MWLGAGASWVFVVGVCGEWLAIKPKGALERLAPGDVDVPPGDNCVVSGTKVCGA